MARGMLIPFLTAVPEEPSPQYYSRCRSKSKRRPDLAIHRSFRWSLPTVEALFQLLPSTKGQSGPMRSHSIGRFCCKTPITPFDEFPANRPNGPRSPIDVAVRPLPRSPVSSSLDNVVPSKYRLIAACTARKICIQSCKKTFATESARSRQRAQSLKLYRSVHIPLNPLGLSTPTEAD